PAGAAGAVLAAGLGYGRHAPHPPFRRVRTGELQLRNRFLCLGSAFQDLHPADASATRPDRLWRPRIAAARLPETFRNASDPVANSPRHGRGVRGGQPPPGCSLPVSFHLATNSSKNVTNVTFMHPTDALTCRS